jgi:hypothetical protein
MIASLDPQLCRNHNAFRLAVKKAGTLMEKRTPGIVKALTGKRWLSPWVMRHSAQQSLNDLAGEGKITEQAIRVMAGRALPRVDRTYRRDSLAAARDAAAMLAAMVPPSIIERAAKAKGKKTPK